MNNGTFELKYIMGVMGPILYYRTRGFVVDASSAFCGFTEWSEWMPVPTEGER